MVKIDLLDVLKDSEYFVKMIDVCEKARAEEVSDCHSAITRPRPRCLRRSTQTDRQTGRLFMGQQQQYPLWRVTNGLFCMDSSVAQCSWRSIISSDIQKEQ